MGRTHSDVVERFMAQKSGESGNWKSWGERGSGPATLVSNGCSITYYRTQLAHWSGDTLVWDVNPFWRYQGRNTSTGGILADLRGHAYQAGLEIPGVPEYTGPDVYTSPEAALLAAERERVEAEAQRKLDARNRYEAHAGQRERAKMNARNCELHKFLDADGRLIPCFRCVVSWQTFATDEKERKAARAAIKAEHEGHSFRWSHASSWEKHRPDYDPNAYYCWTCEDTYRNTHFCGKHHWGGAPSNEPPCADCAAVAAGHELQAVS